MLITIAVLAEMYICAYYYAPIALGALLVFYTISIGGAGIFITVSFIKELKINEKDIC